MSVFYTQPIDLLSADPFDHVELPIDAVLKHLQDASSSPVEDEFLTTLSQSQIVKQEVNQWCKVKLILPTSPVPTIDHIISTWQRLASQNSCLRSTFYTNPKSGEVYQRVLRKPSDIKTSETNFQTPRWGSISSTSSASSPSLVTAENGLPYLSVQQHFGIVHSISLHIRRALVDSHSLGLLKANFYLLYYGLSVPEAPSFKSYCHYVTNSKSEQQARAFWERTFTGIKTAALSETPSLDDLQIDRHTAVSTEISGSFLSQLRSAEQKYGVPQKTLFEAIWAVVLNQHTGAEDVIFGSTGRDEDFLGFDSTIGHLEHTYPVHVRLSERHKVGDLMTELGSYHKEASKHAWLGYSNIKHYLSKSHIDTVISYSPSISAPSTALQLGSFPFYLSIHGSSPVRVTLCHNHMVADELAKALLSHFTVALQSALSKIYLPNTLVSNIELETEAQKVELVENCRSRCGEHTTTITQLFESKVVQTPDDIAVENDVGEKLSFSQLNHLANRLARLLKIAQKSVVVVCMERSIDMVVSLLAILKSGAAYTMIDSNAPPSRNKQIIDDCNPSMILSHRQFQTWATDSRTTYVDDALVACAASTTDLDPSNLGVSIGPKDSCYIIYTSGSTGRPKGVVLTHAAAATGMAHNTLNGRSRWLLFYNPTFSAAQRTILSTMIKGGTLVVASRHNIETNLSGIINACNVDALGITPSALSTLHPRQVPRLRQVTLVGEQISQDLVELWYDYVELRNTYGLSECTQLNFGTKLRPSSNSRIVGRPSDTTSAYIVHPGTLEPAPQGIAGELCLAGPQLGEGYINAEDQTTMVFVDNPYGSGKLYRTGDRAKMHFDGSIEILGRIDFQVKINGQKVEPAEVDRILLQQDMIAACLTVSACINDKNVLVTALIGKEAASWKEVAPLVKEFAQSNLPRYMVPSYWMPVEHIPTNINGKADRITVRRQAEELGIQGLLAFERVGQPGNIVDPRQRKIASTWAAVLKVEVALISSDSTFSSLGGSSIEAIRAIPELAKAGFQAQMDTLLGEVTLEEAAKTYLEVDDSAGQEDIDRFSLLSNSDLRENVRRQAGVDDAYPATPLQEGLLPSLVTGETTYTYQRVWDVSRLDIANLKRSFEVVFRKSEILRTTFAVHGKSFFQLVRANLEFPWIETQETLADYLNQDLQRKFILDAGLVRFGLVSGSILVVTMHHALFDFWSHRFLYQDVASEYLKIARIERPRYAKFVKHIVSQDQRSDQKFFRQYLKNAESTVLNHTVEPEVVKLQQVFPHDLKLQAKRIGLSPGVVCYTAWAIVLSRHTTNTDVTFATTISGRENAIVDIGIMDGPTLTTVPQRIGLDPEQSLVEIATRVKGQFFELMKHSQYGMRNALAAAGSRNALFDTMVNYLMSADGEASSIASQVFTRHGARPVWTSELTALEVEEDQDTVIVRLSGRMDAQRLSFILTSFIKTVSAILDNPEQKLSKVDIVGKEEADYLSNVVSNRRSVHIPEAALLHTRFEQHAQQHAADIAIDWQGERQISYAELDSQANCLAVALIERGVQVGDLIPLMLDKSVDTIVAILAVMKAGAGYVPLSPDNPTERNLFIIRDVSAKLMIMHKQHIGFCEHHNLSTIFIDELVYPAAPVEKPALSIPPNSLAYVIYTSGSTGLPKGVKLPHRAAAAAVESMMVAEGRHHGEWRTLQFANYVFDASVQDIFNTLSSGGALCMAPTERLLSDLAGCINQMSVKQAILTPTVARLLDPKDVPSFSTLIVGGEPLPSDVVKTWLPGHQILNVYGPTETSMVVTQKDVQQIERTSNIGSPFPTVMAYIVEPEGERLVPYGAVGELCIAGPQVSAGYVNRDDLTAASFVRNEVLGLHQLYKTGDLAKWLPNGEIECLGRKDTQVKLHGHRIELGEIEQALRQTGLVQNVAVILTQLGGKAHISAFCIFDLGTSMELCNAEDLTEDISQLKAGLTTLAPYMIPTYIFPMEDFPKLPSRKVDRKALRALAESLDRSQLSQYAMSGSGPKQPVVPVESDVEAILERMWSDVLGIPCDELGREANFQSRGGDSIAAISLSSSARKHGYALGVSDILRFPVLLELATKMKKSKTEDAGPKRTFVLSDEAINTAARAGLELERDIEYAYPCPPGQTEFLNQGATDEQMWRLMAVRRLSASTDPDKWIAATQKLTQINEILRTAWFCVADKEWIGMVLRSTALNLQRVDCADEAQAQVLIEAFWHEAFAIGKPLIKYLMLRYSDGSHDIAIMMDHAVYDGTSLRVFDDHFKSALGGTPTPEHTAFKDFVFHIFESDKEGSLKYWSDLVDQKPATSYPKTASDLPTPKITSKIAKMLNSNLDSLASTCNVTPSTVFQAAYQIWLSRQVSSQDVSFDYLISGRNVNLPDPQSINGTMANFLPVRTQISHSKSVKDYLQTTQDEFWTMTEQGNVSIDEIYAAAGLDRSTYGNKTLFLFQPFEPASGQQNDDDRWLVMAKSKVRMYQPYALVVEVSKAISGAHRLSIMFDENVYHTGDAEKIALEIDTIVQDIVTGVERDRTVEEIV